MIAWLLKNQSRINWALSGLKKTKSPVTEVIWLFSDNIGRSGGIETYLHALAVHLNSVEIPLRVAVCEMSSCPLLDELTELGIPIYRQRRLPGDRWSIRQHALCHWLFGQLKPDDWIFCVRQPREEIFEKLVEGAHKRGARVAASWMFTPDALEINPRLKASFDRAVAQTDCVVSVSKTGSSMYREYYGYEGAVSIVPYHNLPLFREPLPLPSGPPWRLGYIGRIDEKQKNLKALILAFDRIASTRSDVVMDLHGDGPDFGLLQDLTASLPSASAIHFHGRYDHRCDLPRILSNTHAVLYTSRYEGGPCFSLLEAMQAGRYVLASAVGGIPDLYRGHPEAGILIEDSGTDSIFDGLVDLIGKLDRGEIHASGPRSRYQKGWTMDHAHDAFVKALGLNSNAKS